MSALRRFSDEGGGWGFIHWCPGCAEAHRIYVQRVAKYPGPKWTWNGDEARPVFSPSVRCFYTDQDEKTGKPVQVTTCHYFLGGARGDKSGMIEFCPDSPHKLAGQTVPLPDWPYARGAYGGVDE